MKALPMRIGFLVKTFPRLSETFILNEILGLEKLGWDLHIYSLKGPVNEPVHPGVSQVKAPVSYIPSFMPTTTLVDPFGILGAHLQILVKHPIRYVSAIRRYFCQTVDKRLKEFIQAGYLAVSLQKAGITHLHVHFANSPTAVGEVVHWLTGIPFSFTAHAKDIYTSNKVDLARRIKTAASVLTCTGFNERYLRSLSDEEASINLAYHGIDTTRFTAGANNSSEKENEHVPLVLSVGRFCEKKGLDDLIRACAILRDNGVRFRCILVGYGPLEEQLKELRRALQLEALVEMPGRMGQAEVIEQYRKASVFALPCRVTDSGDRDGIPNVLFEAMALGVPVVTTDVSGITELVVERRTGWIVEPQRPDKLAASIEYVLTHPDQAAELAGNARRRVLEEFTLEVSSRRVHDQLLFAVRRGLASAEHRLSVKALYREPNL